MLAEKHYNSAGLADKFTTKNLEYIRPKEVDLVALLEAGATDYMFQYKSVAMQHHMKFIELPDEINLSDPGFNNNYATVSIDVTGSTPGSSIRITGEYINYSLTVINSAPQKDEAIRFVEFLLSPEGIDIFRKNGQDPIIPFSTDQQDIIPSSLLKYLRPNPALK
jgi:molybdate/tungstate transport system substrate-binding protein